MRASCPLGPRTSEATTSIGAESSRATLAPSGVGATCTPRSSPAAATPHTARTAATDVAHHLPTTAAEDREPGRPNQVGLRPAAFRAPAPPAVRAPRAPQAASA